MADWQKLLEDEQRLRNKINWQLHNGKQPTSEALDTGDWQPQPGIKPGKELLQEWWASVACVCSAFSRLVAAGRIPDPLPAELMLVFARTCGYLAVGKMPEHIKDAVGEGQRPFGPSEAHAIGLAVAYHRAAKTGIEHRGQLIRVSDSSPTKNLASIYNVKEHTVRKWVREVAPAYLGSNDISPDALTQMVKQAGKRNKNFLRSAKAIEHRASKRRVSNKALKP